MVDFGIQTLLILRAKFAMRKMEPQWNCQSTRKDVPVTGSESTAHRVLEHRTRL